MTLKVTDGIYKPNKSAVH